VTEQQREAANSWHMRYHPEQHVSNTSSEIEQLLERKRQLLQAIPPRGEKWLWHREITGINQRLSELNQQSWQRSQARLQELALQSRQLKLATSREFSFCLFDKDYAVNALRKLAKAEFDVPVAK
jgi:hypothetical protein